MDILKDITIPIDWTGVGPEFALEYNNELKKEVTPGHPLFDLETKLLLRHKIKNDFLFYVPGFNLKFAEVHLTWSKREIPPWPFTLFFASIQDWLDKKSIEISEHEVLDPYLKYRMPECIPKNLIDLAIPLDDTVHVLELAWAYENVLQLIHLLHQNQIGILGGDVYEKVGDKVEITYDNWYFNWESGSWNEYVLASASTSVNYIKKYQENNPNKEFLFVVSLCESEEAYKKLLE